MTDYQLLIGDCVESMRCLPEQSVNCCVTSPPYFGLRDYGHDGQIGLEETPEAYIAKMVEVFREVKRVLRNDGTLWVNIGDSYARNPAKGGRGPGGKNREWYGDSYTGANAARRSLRGVQREHAPGVRAPQEQETGGVSPSKNGVPNLFAFGAKEKDLIGIPWMLAFALRADGWYLRQDIIWHKPNPMPESVKDRCTKAHEYIFLLSKSPKYYFDGEEVKEPVSESTKERLKSGPVQAIGKHKKIIENPMQGGSMKDYEGADTRNRRSVWSVATKPYKGAHFATFPSALIEPCILAGCPVGGTVLDPFGGSGTTAGVALAHNRKSILCELNQEYADLVPQRVESILASYGKAPVRPTKRKPAPAAQGDIFCGANP